MQRSSSHDAVVSLVKAIYCVWVCVLGGLLLWLVALRLADMANFGHEGRETNNILVDLGPAIWLCRQKTVRALDLS